MKSLRDFAFVEMNQEERLLLIDGVPDILSKEATELQDRLNSARCPRCEYRGAAISVQTSRPFGIDLSTLRVGDELPIGRLHYLMKCLNCDVEYDPDTGMQVTQGIAPRDAMRAAKGLLWATND